MKNLAIVFLTVFFAGTISAQNFGLTANIKALNLNNTSTDEVGDIDYDIESAFSLNFRLFNDNLWALRAGIGVENVEYTVSGGENFLSYLGSRNDYVFVIGLEKHFKLSESFMIYPGIVVPIAKGGKEEYSSTIDELEQGGWRTAVGIVAGANIKFLKVLHIGAETGVSFDSFNKEVVQSLGEIKEIRWSNLNWKTEFTIGLYF
ncbi:hypothetical protein N8482_01060 [Chitinophagales bacterium]|nr:hypothetical protein [Chitinophagales bacterium]